MIALDPALSSLARSLTDVVRTEDKDRLRKMLAGGQLPALGGDLEPADILMRAVEQSSELQEQSGSFASLLAWILSEETQALESTGGELDAHSRITVLNALYVARDLPVSRDLSSALQKLLAAVRSNPERLGRDSNRLLLALWSALTYQQVDGSLEDEWLDLLGGTHAGPAQLSILAQAWRGLLWIPPDENRLRAGQSIDFDRIAKGLLALSNAAVSHRDVQEILEHALEILQETYPRSREFWRKQLSPLALLSDPLHETIRSRFGTELVPRQYTVMIPTNKIHSLIGASGKTISSIVDETGCDIEIEDDGRVIITSADEPAARLAIQRIERLTEVPQVGKNYSGVVRRVEVYGAFIEILPGTDGLVHVSELAPYRVRDVSDVVREGDELTVKVIAIDEAGHVRLSRKAVILESPDYVPAQEEDEVKVTTAAVAGEQDRRGGSR